MINREHFCLENLQNSWLSALPYIVMWILSIFITQIADLMISRGKARTVVVRKTCQSIGEYYTLYMYIHNSMIKKI